jgi:hypothetical protein
MDNFRKQRFTMANYELNDADLCLLDDSALRFT